MIGSRYVSRVSDGFNNIGLILRQMEIRHSNLLAQGHFLRTKAEPNIVCQPHNNFGAVICL